MSEENESSKKSNGAFIAIIILLLLMMAGMAYIWSSKNTALNTCENENKELNTNMKAMDEMLSEYVGEMSNDLQKDFQSMLDTYDALKKNGTPEQNAEIDAQKVAIQQLMFDLEQSTKSGRILGSQIAKLRTENGELRNIMRGYVYEIDSLNTLNLNLQNNLDETTHTLTHTTVERDSAKQIADERNLIIKEGQKLTITKIASSGYKQKLNNEMGIETKAKNVVQIKSDFTIGKNSIADAGNKVVYMQIVDPSGKTLQSSASNVTALESGQVAYSDKKTINYSKQSIDVAIFYSVRGKELSKGNYKVRIYCQGQLIGSDSFTLK